MIDLNCDLGEGEPPRKSAALLDCVTSANIACGGHAGSLAAMRRTVRLAIQRGVRIGAHPGLPDREGFGRSEYKITPREFETLLVAQVSALESVLRIEGGRLHHVKLHGALYHLVERSAPAQKAFLSVLAEFWPGLIVYARAGGPVAARAGVYGLKVWPEGFLDRAYHANGKLASRSSPGALLNPKQFEARLQRLIRGDPFSTIDGQKTQIAARTWCVHGDSPHAIAFARRAREVLSRRKMR